MQRFTGTLPLCRRLSHTVAPLSSSALPAAALPAVPVCTRRLLTASRRSASSVHFASSALQPRRSFASEANKSNAAKADADDEEAVPFALPRAFLVNTATIPGYEIDRVIGFVSGNTVRVRNIVGVYFAGLRAIFGGELVTYTDLMMEAREEATERMVSEAVELGANAIVNIRVESNTLTATASEMYCYGTAVVVKLTAPSNRMNRLPNDGSVRPSVNE